MERKCNKCNKHNCKCSGSYRKKCEKCEKCEKCNKCNKHNCKCGGSYQKKCDKCNKCKCRCDCNIIIIEGPRGKRGKRGPTGPTGPCCPIPCLPLSEDGLNPDTDIIVIQRKNEEGECTLLGITLDQLIDAIDRENVGCATSWAYDPDNSTCFSDIPDLTTNRWGWSNGPYNYPLVEPVDLQLWRSAGQCDISKGELTANITVTQVTDENNLLFTVVAEQGYCICDGLMAIYVGPLQVPLGPNDKPTVAPGQFPVQEETIQFCSGEQKQFIVPVILNDGEPPEQIYILLNTGSKIEQ